MTHIPTVCKTSHNTSSFTPNILQNSPFEVEEIKGIFDGFTPYLTLRFSVQRSQMISWPLEVDGIHTHNIFAQVWQARQIHNRPEVILIWFRFIVTHHEFLGGRNGFRYGFVSGSPFPSPLPSPPLPLLKPPESLILRLKQNLLFEAKKFQEQHSYRFCWAKNSSIYLRKDENSCAIKISGIGSLQRLSPTT